MEILDYITIAVFAAGIMFVGSLFSSTGKNMKSFFAGGGNVPWWISGLSLFMGFFSAGTFVVWGSIAYSMGFVAVTIQLTMAAAGFAVGLLIAPRWNKTGCLTAAEYITRRYGASTQKLYTYIFLFISIFTTGSFLYPIAKIIEVAAGIPLSSSILILGVFCMIYVSLGGLRAVVVTDVLQFIILFAAVIIVIPLAFGEVGGVPEFLARVPEGFFTLFAGEYNWVFIVAFMLYNLFFLGGNWAYVQRYTSVRTPRDAKKVGVLFGVLYTFSPILWMLPPMIYRVFEPGLSGLENENAYLLMCKQTMPAGMLGLMLGGMIFATASSLNATLNISAGVFTNDIFKRLRPAAGETTLMKVARISTLGFGVLAIAVALLIPNMGGIVGQIAKGGDGLGRYVINCYSRVDRLEAKHNDVGGIAGIVSDDSFVINCYSTVEKITANSSYASVVGYSKKGNLQNIYGNSACPSKSAANSAVGSDKAAGTVWKKTTFALLSLDEMKSGAVTVPSSGESCANFAAALNAGAALFNDTPAETLPGKPDVVLRKWTASESYPVLEK